MEEIEFLEEGTDFPKQNASADYIECDDEVTLAAQKAFHITYLFPWQRIVIANILDAYNDCNVDEREDCCTGNDSEASGDETDIFCRGRQIVLLPTGAGKSLCFLTPALILKGPTLVLYPLLALMADQKRRMDEGGLTSVIFKGGQTDEEREENFRRIKEGAKIILANPEVLQNSKLVRRLADCGIAHIAIDEAHCVSEWGDSFRPSYLTLGEIIKKLGVKVVTAFTATASPEVLARVSEVLFDSNAHLVRSDSDRSNIHYNVVNAYAKKRAAFKLAVRLEKPLIIFCGTRKHAEDMARELYFFYRNDKDKVRFYHAGMSREEKTDIEKWFFPKTDGILVCTNAFGMGVNKQDIKSVIHLDCLGSNAESYVQEVGRAARDFSIGNGYLLWSYSDSKYFSQFPENSRKSVIKRFAEADTCRRQILLDALGGEQAVCDGCDVCDRKGPAPFAEDAGLVLKFISRHRKMYRMEELEEVLTDYLNLHDLKEFGMNVWEISDAEEIVGQLVESGFVRICLWPWYKKITCGWGKDKRICEFYYSDFWKRLEEIQNACVKTILWLKTLRMRFLRFLKRLVRCFRVRVS